MGGGSEVKAVGEDDEIVCEGELDIGLIDGEDVPEFGSFKLLCEMEHAGSNLLEEVEW